MSPVSVLKWLIISLAAITLTSQSISLLARYLLHNIYYTAWDLYNVLYVQQSHSLKAISFEIGLESRRRARSSISRVYQNCVNIRREYKQFAFPQSICEYKH